MEVDDFEFCKFYQFIQKNFHNLYENAQTRRHVICIPVDRSLRGTCLDLNFVEYHILKPSPFLKDHFETIHLGNSCTVHIEGNHIFKIEGFEESTPVKILKEEVSYNKEYLTYRILVIEKPLIQPTIENADFQETEDQTLSQPLRDIYLYEECRAFLESHPECIQVLQEMRTKLDIFNKTYLVLPGYLEEASAKLKEIYKETALAYLNDSESEAKTDERYINVTQKAVESYVLHETYSRIYGAVSRETKESERKFAENLEALADVPPEAIGVPSHLSVNFSETVPAVIELRNLKTPVELVKKMKDILGIITATSKVSQNQGTRSSKREKQLITTDDLLPMLVYILIQARLTSIVSLLAYIHHFYWNYSPVDDLSYSLVTFQAAVSHIQHMTKDSSPRDISHTKANRVDQSEEKYVRRDQRELKDQSITQLAALNISENASSPSQRISTFNTVPEVSPTGIKRPSVPLSVQKSSQRKQPYLGSFLTALKNDVLPSSFGKQT